MGGGCLGVSGGMGGCPHMHIHARGLMGSSAKIGKNFIGGSQEHFFGSKT